LGGEEVIAQAYKSAFASCPSIMYSLINYVFRVKQRQVGWDLALFEVGKVHHLMTKMLGRSCGVAFE